MAIAGKKAWKITELEHELTMHASVIRRLISTYAIPNITSVNEKGNPVTGVALSDVVHAIAQDFMVKNQKAPELSARGRSEIAKAVSQEAKNKILLSEYISRRDMLQNQSECASSVVRALDAIPARMFREHPEVPPIYLAAFEVMIQKARNDLVDTLERDGVFDDHEAEIQQATEIVTETELSFSEMMSGEPPEVLDEEMFG